MFGYFDDLPDPQVNHRWLRVTGVISLLWWCLGLLRPLFGCGSSGFLVGFLLLISLWSCFFGVSGNLLLDGIFGLRHLFLHSLDYRFLLLLLWGFCCPFLRRGVVQIKGYEGEGG